MSRAALRALARALCIIGLAAGGAGARPFAAVAPPTLSTALLPVLLGKTRVVATTNVRGASIVWLVNGTVVASRVAPGLKDTLAFVNATCPEISVVQLAIAVPGNGTTTTRVLPCTARPVTPPPAGATSLDTMHALFTAAGVLRPGVLSADDTLTVGAQRIDRDDGPTGRTPFRVWLHPTYDTETGRMTRASLSAPLRCPKQRDPWAGGMWSVDVPGADLLLTVSPHLARAIAAQVPTDSLAEWARRAYERAVRSSAPTDPKQLVWYTECFPAPSSTSAEVR